MATGGFSPAESHAWHRRWLETSAAQYDPRVAARILKGAPLVARWHKQWVHRLMDGRPLSADEKRAAFDFLATDDYREGLDAFLGKRSPVFKGR